MHMKSLLLGSIVVLVLAGCTVIIMDSKYNEDDRDKVVLGAH